jgi:hypothetical protein
LRIKKGADLVLGKILNKTIEVINVPHSSMSLLLLSSKGGDSILSMGCWFLQILCIFSKEILDEPMLISILYFNQIASEN